MKALIFALSLIMPTSLFAQTPALDDYQVKNLDKAQIRQSDILPYLEQVKQDPLFSTTEIGRSYENRPVYRIQVGQGPLKVMMWSQMHGDESTATPALFDLIERIRRDEDWRESWQDEISLILIPMLNPDGAELAQRHNAQGIDINRDAKDLQTPEGRILMAQAKEIQPDIGFNLHDQSRFYSAGNTDKTATISLLAPAFDEAKSISDQRKRAMQLIGILKQVGDEMIPGHLGRYDDTYAERAFGDTLAGMGISTILIESGAYPGDINRQVARKVNLAMLGRAIDSLVTKSYQKLDLAPYQSIPMNERNAFRDVVISDLRVVDKEHRYLVDLALDLDLPEAQQVQIDEIGDLSPFPAFFRFDAGQWQFQPAKGMKLEGPLPLTRDKYLELLGKGVGYFEGDETLLELKTDLPVAVNPGKLPTLRPLRNQQAVFFLKHEDGRRIAVIQGILVDLTSGKRLNQYST
ncbi:M14 family metallopeptidase [Bowmanella dokdonensis]|uniref:Peptidase M14 n=1 Tax=Bowmanella dokdonensis TaxID=751969 RepID=A0A939ISD2_9ALTE|nr:M14 metallopeptidase family protein [Bowmanella dokdonensis]MBN7826607.1 peptidase M14 [Bowmanella dokdonensis]